MCSQFSLRQFGVVSGIILTALLSACGGDSDSDSSGTTSVSMRFSDAPVEDAAKVVITVDSITFNRAGAEDIVVDTFTSDELGIQDAETFQLDLLEVQGNDSRLVIDSVELPVGEYSNLRLGILDDDVNFSFVEEVSTGEMKPIKVPSDELKLGGFTVAATSTQTFVVEFGLRQSLVHNPTPERYILKPRGVRVVELETAPTLVGNVDLNALHGAGACADKVDQTIGNVAYLYTGHGLDASNLGDVYISQNDAEPGAVAGTDFDPDVPADVIAPYAVTAVDGSGGDYVFSFLESGDYTLALSCQAENDDPVTYDGLNIPAPATELVELTLGLEEDVICDFPLVDGACADNTAN